MTYPKARFFADRRFVVGQTDPRLFGSFVEHVGRAVYGGIYEPDHPDADENGFRRDVLNAVRGLNVSTVRYPGGNFVSGYRWEDGIGPADRRPVRPDLAWRSIESNRVGIDEFVRWAKSADTSVMLAVNLGTRGVDAARNLVEYCNFPGGTYYSDLRARNGSATPHGIKTWCLGNEMDGPWQIGTKTPEEYGRLAAEAGKVMKLTDPGIELVVCGSSGPLMPGFPAWEEKVLDLTYDVADYVSVHYYPFKKSGDSAEFLGQPVKMESFIRTVRAACDLARAKKRGHKNIDIAFDEWNVWYRTTESWKEIAPWQTAPPIFEEYYSLEDAVTVGGMLLTLLRNADRVRMACLAQLVNVLAPIMTESKGSVWLQTIYYPFADASRFGRGTVLQVSLDTPKYDAGELTDVPLIDAVAVLREAESELTIFAVNRSLNDSVLLDCDLRTFGAVRPTEHRCLTGDSPEIGNDPGCPDRIKPIILPNPKSEDGVLSALLPPLSWNMLRLKLAER